MRKIKKIIKYVISTIFTISVLLVTVAGVGRFINAQKYKITTKSGIDVTKYVNIGGIEQYIQIRGQDKNNPIILILHGGPGSPMAFFSYNWQTPLEDKYTIVNWDQRGCSNTYYKNASKPTLELLLEDLDELVDWLKVEFNQNKVIILAHSWGTILGSIYSHQHPEKVAHYIAVGLLVNSKDGELVAANHAIELAQEKGDYNQVREIETNLALVMSSDSFNSEAFNKLHSLTSKYLPQGNTLPLYQQIAMGAFSPYMTFSDLKWYLLPMFNFDKYLSINRDLLNADFGNPGFSLYDYSLDYAVPFTVIAGDADWITPYSLAQDYFNKISAPHQAFYYIKNCGHSPFLDQPQDFVSTILKALAE